jgi:FkbM family methyltransferase
MMVDILFRWTKRKAADLAPRIDHGSQILFHLLYGLHNRLLGLNPGPLTMTVRGAGLEMPPDHLLPFYLGAHPLLDQPLAELAERIATRDGHLHAIDVGANIGDTTALMAARVRSATFLCVEGSDKYLPYLRANIARLPPGTTTFLEALLLGEKDELAAVSLSTQFGTGFLSATPGARTPIRALDSVLEEGPYRGLPWNLLKLDTDGYDFNILKGAERLLKERGPAIFFEYVPQLFHDQGTDPMEVFRWLADRGYSEFTMFTNFGEKLLTVDPRSFDAVAQLSTYSSTFRRLHYDVLAMKSSKPPTV